MSPNPYTVVTMDSDPYGVNRFLDTLQGYNQSTGVIELLDLSRIINDAENYFWQGTGFPEISPGVATNFTGNQTQNGTIALPAGTYITALTFFSSQPEGLKLKMWDKGTKASIFYGDYAKDQLIMSPMDTTLTTDIPFGPAYLQSPFIITPPGNLNWEIVNTSPNSSLIQIMVCCAVPVNNQSLNLPAIQRG